MGQIVSLAAKPKRCNLNQLSQVPTPAAGEHILVSSDNSMNAAGQGNFDCYIVGDNKTAATSLPLHTIASNDVKWGGKNGVTSGGVFNALPHEEIEIDTSGKITGSMRITGGVVAFSSTDNYRVVGYDNPIRLNAGDTLVINHGTEVYNGTWASVVTRVVMNGETPEYTCLVQGDRTKVYQYTAETGCDVIVCNSDNFPITIERAVDMLDEIAKTNAAVAKNTADIGRLNDSSMNLDFDTTGYINTNTHLPGSSSTRKYTSQYYKVYKDDVIELSVYATSNEAGIALYSGNTGASSEWVGAYNFTCETGQTTTFVVPQDGYIRFTNNYNKNTAPFAKYIIATELRELIADVDEKVEENETYLATGVKSSVPSPTYTTGAMKTTGSVDSSATSYGYVAPILLEAGNTIVLNSGNEIYEGRDVAVVYQCSSSGTYEKTLIAGASITKQESYTNTLGEDIYVGISAYTGQLGYRIDGLEKAASLSDINGIEGEIQNQQELIDRNFSLITGPIMQSPSYPDGGDNWDRPYNRFIIHATNGNKPYLNKKIFGLNVVSRRAGGTFSIIKATLNAQHTQVVDGTYEVVQTFDVVQGLNELKLDEPLVLTGDSEYLGIDGSTGGEIAYSTDRTDPNRICFYWYNSNTSAYAYGDKDMIVSVIASKVPSDGVNLDDVVEELGNLEDGVEASDEMLPLPFLGNPCYYHWHPNGFINNIPSQSVEDNMLAKRLGFSIVEVNHQATATDGKYVVTHGNGGKFGSEFSSTYADVLINSMTYADIVANVKYNSEKACYNHTISTLDAFMKNCSQLGLGVYLRTSNAIVVGTARKYIADNKIVIEGGSTVRSDLNFKGMLSSYIAGNDGSTIGTLEYLRNYANTHGGKPYHIVVNGTIIEYMIANGTLESIVSTLRSEGIYLGCCYASNATLEQLTAVGGVGHAADIYQCNPFADANVGAWSPLDTDTSGWTIPSGITGVSSGKLVNNTNAAIVVETPSTGAIPLSKGQVNARIKGDVTFTFGGVYAANDSVYTGYSEENPIVLAAAGIGRDMKLTITIGANSSVEFLTYQVTKC